MRAVCTLGSAKTLMTSQMLPWINIIFWKLRYHILICNAKYGAGGTLKMLGQYDKVQSNIKYL